MSEFKVNTITNRDGSYGPQVCGITTFGSSGMQLPSGPTEMRGGRGRAVFAGGSQQPMATQWHNVIDKVEIATTGNAVDFGDLINNNANGGCASYSSLTRGCFAGIRTPTVTNTIEYVTMSTLGNALNFGDLTQPVNNGGGCSNGHGGLG